LRVLIVKVFAAIVFVTQAAGQKGGAATLAPTSQEPRHNSGSKPQLKILKRIN
jgi:hypothetical protein